MLQKEQEGPAEPPSELLSEPPSESVDLRFFFGVMVQSMTAEPGLRPWLVPGWTLPWNEKADSESTPGWPG